MRKLHYFILSTFVLLSGCDHPTQIENRSVFRYNQESDISSLDPAFARDQANIWAVNQIFNGLVQLNDQLIPEPAIAKSWEILDEGTRYRFVLRNDVYFHETTLFGASKTRVVTAADFVFTFERLINPAIASPGAWIFNDKVVAQQAFVAINDTTFEITLKAPFPPFLGLLSMQYCSVVPREVVTYYGNDFRANPIGTGPFRFAFWEQQEALVLHRNPNYFEQEYGAALPYLDAIQVSFLPDKQAAFLAFMQGKLDYISGIDPAFKDEILTRQGELKPAYQDKIKLQKAPYLNTEYLGILMENKSVNKNSPLLQQKIRQAINYGFDREKMMRYLRNGIGTAGTAGFIPPGLPGFDSSALQFYSYQPEKARQLLKEANYTSSSASIRLLTTPSYLDLCVFIQKQLQEIGLKVSIETSPGPTLRQLINKSEAPFFRGSWIADYPDAENYLALFYSKNFTPAGPNFTHYANPTFDQLYEKALLTVGDKSRIALYMQMDSILREDVPMVVLYYDQLLRLVQPNISGLTTNPLNLLQLKRVKKSAKGAK
jgi:peptide/nickel transport system substrate-binding protein